MFIQRDIIKRYKEFYPTKWQNNVDLIFRSNYFKKLNEIPAELVDHYFTKNLKIKNLGVIDQSLAIDLIKAGRIDPSYIKTVINTCNFNIIESFLEHNTMTMNSDAIKIFEG